MVMILYEGEFIFRQIFLDARHPVEDPQTRIERFRRNTVGKLETELTIDDPKAYVKPLKYTLKASLVPDEDLREYFCAENEKGVQHFQ